MEFVKPDFSVISGSETKIASDGIRVSGKMKNLSSFPAGEAKIIGILTDKYGDPLFAGQTAVPGISTRGSRLRDLFPGGEGHYRQIGYK